MGKFGQTLGEKLLAMGDEVMIADKSEELVNSFAPKYTDAIIANCMNLDNLKALDIPSFDVCVVAIGDDFQSSLEITSLLKDEGAKYVVSKATTEIQKKFLLKNGADEVIYPDSDIAEKLAIKINSTKVYDYIELSNEYSIMEIEVPTEWRKRRLIDVNPRKKYDLNILTIKNIQGNVFIPNIEYAFEEGDHMTVFGKTEKILAFTNKKKKH